MLGSNERGHIESRLSTTELVQDQSGPILAVSLGGEARPVTTKHQDGNAPQ